jgi:pimeloyl-ACP methyl ester carboxylesterase
MERSQTQLHGQCVSYQLCGSGPLIVLLHGIAGDSTTWEEVVPWLTPTHTVLAPDLLGHGRSCKPEGDYSLGAYANGLRDLLEALELERGTIVGHSLGGGIAMQFAYQFPERCERLALVSSGGLGRELHGLLRAAALPGAGFVLPWLCVAGRQSVGRVVHGLGRLGLRASADLEESWRSFVSLEDAEARRAFLTTVRGLIDLGGQRITAIDRLYLTAEVPTLIVWGEKDPLIPVEHGREAHASMPGSRLEIFADAGHFPHRDAPRRFASALLDFVRSTEPASGDGLRRRLQSGVPRARATPRPRRARTAN